MGGQKLTSAEQILMMRSIIGIWESGGPFGLQLRKSVGRVLSNMVYFRLSNPITLSTCILTFAIPLDFSTSTGSNWDFPLVKAGITSLPCLRPTLCEIVKTLSNKPQFSVKCLSDVRPPQASDTKHTVPCGVMPIKTFMVLWCLYGIQELNIPEAVEREIMNPYARS